MQNYTNNNIIYLSLVSAVTEDNNNALRRLNGYSDLIHNT